MAAISNVRSKDAFDGRNATFTVPSDGAGSGGASLGTCMAAIRAVGNRLSLGSGHRTSDNSDLGHESLEHPATRPATRKTSRLSN